MAAYVREMQRAAEVDDPSAEASADASFHSRMMELAGNATLERVWRTLEPFSRTYITLVAPGSDRRHVADEHLPVLDALRRRDPELAVEVLHQHFANAAARLGSHWDDGSPLAAEAPAPPAPLRAFAPSEAGEPPPRRLPGQPAHPRERTP
jgi:DNA-binding GntR family transcriptional regulator